MMHAPAQDLRERAARCVTIEPCGRVRVMSQCLALLVGVAEARQRSSRTAQVQATLPRRHCGGRA